MLFLMLSINAISGASLVVPGIDPTDSNLVAYWNFDDTIDPFFNPPIPTGNPPGYGLLVVRSQEPVFEQGVLGSAIKFDGSYWMQAVSNGQTSFNTPQFSFSLLVKPEQRGDAILAKKGMTNTQGWFVHLPTNNYVWAKKDGLSVGQNTIVNNFLEPGKWHHVVFTYDGSAVKLFVNGLLVEGVGTTGYSNTDNIFYLGTWDGSSEMFQGSMDEVVVYKDALSDTEIADLYNFYLPYMTVTPSPPSTSLTSAIDMVNHILNLVGLSPEQLAELACDPQAGLSGGLNTLDIVRLLKAVSKAEVIACR